MGTPFFSGGLRFQCQKCSACCRFDPGIVSLSENDLNRLVAWAGIPRSVFLERYCRWVSVVSPSGKTETRLCLQEKPDYDCILWDNGCTAYEARPLQCRSFPFWESVLQNESSWNSMAAECPGINCGNLHCGEEISGWLEKRKNEPFITRADG